MHIPDGYLSPSTCAVLYGVALPFWYGAFARIKRLLHTRLVPLLAVASAFCFVVMMFNVPLPGGTTGHAVGVAAATIILGPWSAMLSVSIALLIQAIFFGDGGITTLGANCFNMAIVGSLVAYAAYRVIAGGAPLSSRRRVVAAAIAGYLAVNASALVAAVEFGIQPILFHDASGTPLYAPYPLRIALPAMMIGHLTFAGLAEAVISAGLVAYLQAADPGLLRSTSGLRDGPAGSDLEPATHSFRRLWIAIAVLMLMTPLGILAAGSAWGEWSPSEIGKNAGSDGVAVPAGLERLSSVWTAPFPAYAPTFVHSRGFGYLLSAMFGVGLLLALSLISQALLARYRRKEYAS